MTVLLTGGSGFLGSHIAEQLSRAERPVRALVRKTSDVSFLRTLPRVELVEGALGDRRALGAAMRGISAVIHAAGLIKAQNDAEFFRVNAEGTEQLLEAALAEGDAVRRFVLVSSVAAIGPSTEGAPLVSDCDPHPVTGYGRSKRAGENAALALKSKLSVTILRPPAIYGPRDRETLTIFQTVRWGVLPTFGSLNHQLTIIHGQDAARACVRAVDADVPSGSAFFLDDGSVHTFAELYTALEDALGQRAWLRFPLPRRLVESVALGTEFYGRVRKKAVMLTRDKCHELFAEWVTDSKPAQQALGWKPEIGLSDGIRQTAAWYREQAWL